ncbi:MAG: ribonuclease Z [archaeon]
MLKRLVEKVNYFGVEINYLKIEGLRNSGLIEMKVTFLGTSGSLPTKKRSQPSIHLQHGNNSILWDCGEGTQRQIMKTNISPFKINSVYITHLHADHLIGLAGLIQSLQFMGREEKLEVYGPEKIDKYVDFFKNWDYFKLGFNIEVKEVKEGVIKEDEDYVMRAFPVEHRCPAYGYVFEEKPGLNLDKEKLKEIGLFNHPKCRDLKEKGVVEHRGKKIKIEDVRKPEKNRRKIVYSGDTKHCEKLKEASEGADLLIVDSTFGEEHEDKAFEYGHGEAKLMAKLAKEANVDKLVLTHFSNRYEDEKVLEESARGVFKESYAARDLMEIEID